MKNNQPVNTDLLHTLLDAFLPDLSPTTAGQVLFANSLLFFSHQASPNPNLARNALLMLASHSIPPNSEALRNFEAYLLTVREALESHQQHQTYQEIYRLYRASPLFEVTEIDLAPRG